MRVKLWLKYLAYIIGLSFIIGLWGYVGLLAKKYSNNTFQFFSGYVVVALLLEMGIGIILGLEHFVTEIKKEGNWRVNLPKLILVGLPSLFISLSYILAFSGLINSFVILGRPIFHILYYGNNSLIVARLIFGYTVITSLYKQSK